ncbi:molybdate ABC transporter substrate-binding protein [Photobacterium kagoshimensis]|uniref:molybdate ABC transporter substrate-binding protein n=1 Tax=Photobacterium kagoshimensis TaxID=2910242 RepID=UPI003D0BE385
MKKNIAWLVCGVGLVASQYTYAAETVTVFAASSLTNAVTELSDRYQEKNGVDSRLSFASSSALARQISQGAPADIYISANVKWMDYLQSLQVIENDSRKPLLENSLVMVAPLSYPNDTVTPSASWDVAATLMDTRMAVGDPNHVPAGRYAQQALENLGVWEAAKPHLARANNVRSALVLVERGESNLGIVYKTDAKISKKVKIVAEFPDSSHAPIRYPMAIVKNKATPVVQNYYMFLQSEEAKAVFEKYGFEVVSAN